MKEREELARELHARFNQGAFDCWDAGAVADFILADRKRIVKPLIKYKRICKDDWGTSKEDRYIDQTLKNAGVVEEL